LFEQAPHSPEYVPENHIPVYIPEPEHPEDLVPAEDEAPIPPLPPSFLSLRTPPLLPIPLPTPSTSHRAKILEANTPPRKRLLLTTPRPSCEVGESSATAAAVRQPGPTMAHRVDYSPESIETYEALTRSEAYYRAIEAQVIVIETQAYRYEWQCQAVDDFAIKHIMRTQALEAGAHVDTLEDTGSSS
ncbi:hypothetical protein Tco_0300361, partial [Tanacetum coccineum]